MRKLREIEVEEFVKRLREMLELKKESCMSFFIGAGCSLTCGIPTSEILVKRWLKRLKLQETGDESNVKNWAKKRFANFKEETVSFFYGKMIEELFKTPEKRQLEIESLTDGKFPGFGYAALSSLMTHEFFGRRTNIAITTNFDDLLADALYLYTGKKPLVKRGDTIPGFERFNRNRPLIVKTHGDYMLELSSAQEQDKKSSSAYLKKVLKNIFIDSGIIFTGYNGQDNCIAEVFDSMPAGAFPWGVYWVNNKFPQNDFGEWLKKKNAVWVKHLEFDELMFHIMKVFDLALPNKERIDDLFKAFNHTFKMYERDRINPQKAENIFMTRVMEEKPEEQEPPKAPPPAVPGGTGDLSDANKRRPTEVLPPGESDLYVEVCKLIDDMKDTYKKALKTESTDSLVFRGKTGHFADNYCTNDEAEEFYIKALELDPNNIHMLFNYANFLADVRDEYDRAEDYYKKALRIAPGNAHLHTTYAIFLTDLRKNYDEAEKHYRKAVSLKPNNAVITLGYAIFLKDIKQDYDEAEVYYRRALKINPNNVTTLVSFSIFLTDIRKDYEEAGKYFESALKIEPDNVNLLCNYANFLSETNASYFDAEKCYKRAIELAPDNAAILYNYAVFLDEVRNFYSKAEEYYKKALDLEPDNVIFITSYATFLTDVRKAYDKAEQYFIRALKIEPENAAILYNYANLFKLALKSDER